MRRTRILMLTVALIGLIGVKAQAGGTNQWSTGYPKTGTGQQGTILVKGNATADAGFTFTGNGTVVCWPVGSGRVLSFNITVNSDGTWGETTIAGLTSGIKYNVVVQVGEVKGQTHSNLATDPGMAQAK